MKALITVDGKLMVRPEGSTEVYALLMWYNHAQDLKAIALDIDEEDAKNFCGVLLESGPEALAVIPEEALAQDAPAELKEAPKEKPAAKPKNEREALVNELEALGVDAAELKGKRVKTLAAMLEEKRKPTEAQTGPVEPAPVEPTPEAAPVEEAKPDAAPTLDEMREHLEKFLAAHGNDAFLPILEKYDAKKLTDIDPSQWAAVKAACVVPELA